MSEKDILALSPRQTQIKLFELYELELETDVKYYLQHGIKPEDMEGEIKRKYDELNGVEHVEIDAKELALTEDDKKFIEALKKGKDEKEFLKNGG
jgi:hypothetical protein